MLTSDPHQAPSGATEGPSESTPPMFCYVCHQPHAEALIAAVCNECRKQLRLEHAQATPGRRAPGEGPGFPGW